MPIFKKWFCFLEGDIMIFRDFQQLNHMTLKKAHTIYFNPMLGISKHFRATLNTSNGVEGQKKKFNIKFKKIHKR